jgi:hypothetical protein
MVHSSGPGRLGIDIHLLRDGLAALDLVHRDVLADLLAGDDLLVQHRRGAALEHIALLLLAPLVGLDEAALEGGLLLSDYGDIDVRPGSQVVEDTRLDGVGGQRHGLVLGHGGLPLGLEDRHRRERAAAHGDVRQLVGAAVGVNGEQADARGVDARHDEVRADVALVAEQVLLEHGHAGDDAGLAARRERVQLQLRRDERRCEFRVGRRPGARAPDLRRDVMELLAVLVRHDRAAGSSGVGGDLGPVALASILMKLAECRLGRGRGRSGGPPWKPRGTYHHTTIKYTSYNRRPRASRLG